MQSRDNLSMEKGPHRVYSNTWSFYKKDQNRDWDICLSLLSISMINQVTQSNLGIKGFNWLSGLNHSLS